MQTLLVPALLALAILVGFIFLGRIVATGPSVDARVEQFVRRNRAQSSDQPRE